MAYRKVDDTSLSSVADAIRSKGGTSDTLIFPDGFVTAISAIQTGGGGGAAPSAKWSDVTFIDYDGTVLYTYTMEEAGMLTELPPLPSHAGLICQEWNYTLNEVTSATTPIIVGANYTTSDGKTRLYLTFYSEDDTSIKLALYVSGAIVIDWGDGSNTESVSVSGSATIPHTYTVNTYPQSVVIEIHATSGEFEIGHGSSTYGVLRGNDSTLTTTALTAVEIGENVPWINSTSFAYSPRLKTIAINKDCTKFSSSKSTNGVSAWSTTGSGASCGVVALVYPRGTRTSDYSGYFFANCRRLEYVSTPKTLANVTIIGNNSFSNCYALRSITIPDGVTSIGTYVFSNCYGMRYYDFSACTSIPALSNTNAFNKIPSDCQMMIPSALYNNWKSATNWATYASKMVSV